MELKLESVHDKNETIHVALTNGDEPAISLLISRLGSVNSILLTQFEARMLATAILTMANHAEIVESLGNSQAKVANE